MEDQRSDEDLVDSCRDAATSEDFEILVLRHRGAVLRLIFPESAELDFSPGFLTRLRRGLSERRLRRSLSRKARGIVSGYAAFALASSAWILATIDWAGTTPGRALLGLSLTSLALLPLLLSLGRLLAAPRLR